MIRYFLFSALMFFGILLNAQDNNLQKFYVGTFTSEGAEGIYFCSFNPETGDLKLENTLKAVDDPSFLKLSPDKKFLYVVTRAASEVEKSGGYVVSYKVGEKGNLHFLNKQVANGDGACHVDVSPDGKYVAIATYNGGTTSLYPVHKDGKLGEASTVIKNTGYGPNKDRQSVPHAHSIKFSRFGNEVFSADLGTDQLNIYHLEGDALKTEGQSYVKMAPGAGPRHFEYHPTEDVIYVISELNSTVTSLRQKDGNWKIFQTLSALPKDFNGESYCADIHISKDGKYLYGSNRGHNSIAVFDVNKNDQTLKFKETVSVEGNWPRNFSITPDGKWMLVANQKSGDITVFKIDNNGIPVYNGNKLKLPAPVCIDFL